MTLHPQWRARLARAFTWMLIGFAVGLIVITLASLLAPEPGVFEGTYTPVPVVEEVVP